MGLPHRMPLLDSRRDIILANFDPTVNRNLAGSNVVDNANVLDDNIGKLMIIQSRSRLCFTVNPQTV
jgi:hypothetical protein